MSAYSCGTVIRIIHTVYCKVQCSVYKTIAHNIIPRQDDGCLHSERSVAELLMKEKEIIGNYIARNIKVNT